MVVKLYHRFILRSAAPSSEFTGQNYKQINDIALSLLPLLSNGPKFTVLVPVYRPNLMHFQEMVTSVLRQSYTNWQLVLVDDASQSEELNTLLSNYQLNDKVDVIQRDVNGHISIASNTGLEAATGDYVVLLDHDDLLHEHALKTVAFSLSNNPGAKVLYSDEDKVLLDGSFGAVHHKPGWNPDLLFSHNYLCHLAIYKKTVLDEIGGFREGVEGSQDFDLALRATQVCEPDEIVHIPYVLYSWRMAPGSTALAAGEKSYTHQAGLQALKDRFAGSDIRATDGVLENTYRLHWPIPAEAPLVSIIIPTRNGQALVEQCIRSIESVTTYPNYEIVLIDNQSDDPEALAFFTQLAEKPNISVHQYPQAFNYSAINNFAVEQVKGEVIVLMNNDIEVLSNDWLEEMVGHALREDIGCVGSKLYYPDGKLQHAGVITGIGGVAGHAHKYFPKEHPGYFKRLMVAQNYSAVTAACLAVRKEVFEQVGGLDEQNLTVAFNDVDLCLKVQQAGYRNLWTPYAEMIHHESISRGHEDTPEKQARFSAEVVFMQQKWGRQLMDDPCYSQWLTLDREDFSSK
ncbi:glycosyltransferase family 2 protein [Vibrio sp. 1159]|uniref:glycosyltransferase family 2 protein n=1 Tax=Vibrio sp. 1159 TaxID=3074545 RepID=UPI002964464B|nr:glycosyltransferase family 2 protein [Vibrio sp. 1159]MDW2323625.1 glycosyltransferase family 2 protein [Vibrio sp. 1159]